MKYYFRVWKRFFVNAVSAGAAFRANFIINVVVSFAWIAMSFALVNIVFSNTGLVAGWTKLEVFAVFGIFEIVDGLISLFVWSGIVQIPQLIRDGSIDYLVTKPINSQFQAAFKQFEPSAISTFATGLGIMIYVSSFRIIPINLEKELAALFLVICGIVIYYSLAMMAVTLNFWFIRLENITALLTMSVVTARYPLNVFKGVLEKFVFFVLPLAFFATVPAMVLFGKVPALPWLIIGLFLSLIFIIISWFFWQFGLRSYSSASS